MAKYRGDAQHVTDEELQEELRESKPQVKDVKPEDAGFNKYFSKDDCEKLVGLLNSYNKFAEFSGMTQSDIFRHTSYATHVTNVVIPKMKKLTIEEMRYYSDPGEK